MKKADKFKLLYILGISLIFFFAGCVDTGVQNIATSFDFHSQVDVVNLSSNGGAATIKVYNVGNTLVKTISSLPVGGEFPGGTTYMDLPSGSYTFIINYASVAKVDTFKQVMDTDLRLRLYVLDVDSVTRTLDKNVQRYTWQSKDVANGKALFPADTASIMFVNGTPAVTLTKVELTGTTATYAHSLAVGAGSPYQMFKVAGSTALTCNFYGASSSGGDSLLTSVSLTPKAQSRYSAVLYKDASGKLAGKVYTDD